MAGSPSGTVLAFLGAASNCPGTGTGTITYSDGGSQRFQLGLSDWTLNGGATAQPDYGNGIAARMPYRNYHNGFAESVATYLF